MFGAFWPPKKDGGGGEVTTLCYTTVQFQSGVARSKDDLYSNTTLTKPDTDSAQQYLACTVKPVKLATLVSRPPVTVGHVFMEPANSYDIIHGHYSLTWPPAYLESWPQFSSLVLCFTYKCNLPMLANPKILYFLCHIAYRPNPHLLCK
jgi:hypothetical protein